MTNVQRSIYKRFFKRPLDIICSIVAIIVASPIFMIIAVLVRTKLGSPIFFKQQRPGLNEEIFIMYKFRTMTDETDKKGDLLPDSIRLTKFGEFLRSTSMDELPGLLNVLKGDMSIIGPRPLLVKYLDYYYPSEKVRHQVRPGLSGLAQVNGRNNLDWDKRLSLDIEYVENITFLVDIQIILKTILKVIKKEDIVVVDQADLKDLDVERKKKMLIKLINIEEFKQHRDTIRELLFITYRINFEIENSLVEDFCTEKIDSLEVFLKDNTAKIFACLEGNELLGFAWIYEHSYFSEKRIHVNQIVVKEQSQGKGIGKLLLKTIDNFALENNINCIDLFVSENNNSALNLYTKEGFVTERRYLSKNI